MIPKTQANVLWSLEDQQPVKFDICFSNGVLINHVNLMIPDEVKSTLSKLRKYKLIEHGREHMMVMSLHDNELLMVIVYRPNSKGYVF